MSSQQEPWQSDPQLAQLLKLSKWTAAQAEQMLQIQRQSGLSVMAFCHRIGIKHHRLYTARNKQERSLSQPTPKPAESLQVQSMLPPEFVPIRVSAAATESTVSDICAELCHPSGVRLLLSAQTPDSLARALCSVLVSAC